MSDESTTTPTVVEQADRKSAARALRLIAQQVEAGAIFALNLDMIGTFNGRAGASNLTYLQGTSNRGMHLLTLLGQMGFTASKIETQYLNMTKVSPAPMGPTA